MRFGGWRPTVFMEHGLQVALWMGFCLLIAYVTLRMKPLIVIERPKYSSLILLSLGGTFLLLKSLGSLALVASAVAIFELARFLRLRVLYLTLPACVVGYLILRGFGLGSPDALVSFVRDNISAERAESFQFRIDNEDLLAAKARKQVWLGWGGWGRNRVFDEYGKDISVTDGLWIIIFGTQGVLGLSAFYAMQLMAPTLLLFGRRFHENAAVTGLALSCLISSIDTLPNAMSIPIFQLVLGALVTVSFSKHADTAIRSRSAFDSI
jgi:hypothetical protein